MRIVTTLEALRRVRGPVVMAAGFFDGVHRGHQKVLRATLDAALRADGQGWVLTFSDHPMSVIGQGVPPRLLTSTRHRLRLFKRMGFDGCVLLPFTRMLARLAPEAFVHTLCCAAPSLAEMHVGSNWRFGCDGAGDPTLLKQLGVEAGFTVSVVRPVLRNGQPISSTRIRQEIEKGRLEEAAAMLGRPFSLLGAVQRGRTVGRMLGVPTANLDVENEILPPRGVYAVQAEIDGRLHVGVLNLGVRPTYRGRGSAPLSIELHVLDFEGDLYGKTVEVYLAVKLRNERRFASEAALKSRITRDIEKTRAVLARKKLKRIPLHA